MAQTISTDFLPDTTGRDLGAPTKQWDAYLRDVIITGNLTAPSSSAANVNTSAQIVSSLPDGTAPLSVLSQTKVANLNVDLLDGKDWASPAAIGTGTPAPANFTTLGVSGQITSTLATGTAPINVASITKCPNLNADLLDGSDWSAPPAMGGTTPVPSIVADAAVVTSITNTNLTSANLTVGASVAANGGGIKHKRVTTGSVAAGARAIIAIPWTTAFPDTNYTPVAMVREITLTTAVASLRIERITAKETAQIKVQIINDSAGALTGEISAIAMHD